MRYPIFTVAIATAFLVAGVSPAAAQQAPLVIDQTPQPQPGNVLKQGTLIHLATDTEMNSNDNRVGDRIDLRLLDAVELNGHTVIPVGTRGVGEVTLVRKKGMWGKSGRLEFRPLFLVLGDREIPISSRSMTKEHGDTGTAGVVASVVVLPLAGFFVTGTSARIPRGSTVDAELSEDLPVVFSNAAQLPTNANTGAAPAAVPVQVAPAAPVPVSVVPVAAKPN